MTCWPTLYRQINMTQIRIVFRFSKVIRQFVLLFLRFVRVANLLLKSPAVKCHMVDKCLQSNDTEVKCHNILEWSKDLVVEWSCGQTILWLNQMQSKFSYKVECFFKLEINHGVLNFRLANKISPKSQQIQSQETMPLRIEVPLFSCPWKTNMQTGQKVQLTGRIRTPKISRTLLHTLWRLSCSVALIK